MPSLNVPSTLAGPGTGCCGKSTDFYLPTTLKSALGWVNTNPHSQHWSSSAPLPQPPAFPAGSITWRGEHRGTFGNFKPVFWFGDQFGSICYSQDLQIQTQLTTGLSLDPELSLPSTGCLNIPSAESSSPPLLSSPCSAAEWGFPASFQQGKTHSDQFLCSVLLWGLGLFCHQARLPTPKHGSQTLPQELLLPGISCLQTTQCSCHHPQGTASTPTNPCSL